MLSGIEHQSYFFNSIFGLFSSTLLKNYICLAFVFFYIIYIKLVWLQTSVTVKNVCLRHSMHTLEIFSWSLNRNLVNVAFMCMYMQRIFEGCNEFLASKNIIVSVHHINTACMGNFSYSDLHSCEEIKQEKLKFHYTP